MSCPPISGVMRQASYRGASFHVSSTSESFGRRVIVHEFPLIDSPFLEDMGEKAQKISIEGYLIGANWLSARDALISACRRGGAGTLVHPFYSQSTRARCLDLKVAETKDDLGRVSVTMEFVVASSSLSGSFSISFAIANMQFSVGASISAGGLAFNAGVNFTQRIPAEATASAIRSAAISLDEARLLSRVNYTAAPALASSIAKMYSQADLAARGTVALNDLLLDVVVNYREAGADNPADVARNLKPLLSFGLDYVPSRYSASSYARADANHTQTAAYLRRSIGLLYGEFASSADYDRRSDALRAQNEYALWVDGEDGRISLGSGTDSQEAFDRARARTMEVFTRKHTDLSPSIAVTLPAGMTSLTAAMRFYGDPGRALDIWRASRSPHPSVLPRQVTIEANV